MHDRLRNEAFAWGTHVRNILRRFLNIKDTEEFLVPTFRYIAYEKKGGLYCTTVNQTINDLLRADGDNQVIQEALANYYDMYGESFDGLTIDADLIPRFNRYKEWALEYYT